MNGNHLSNKSQSHMQFHFNFFSFLAPFDSILLHGMGFVDGFIFLRFAFNSQHTKYKIKKKVHSVYTSAVETIYE